MTVDSNLVPIDPEDSFLLAVERLESGVALETVLAEFPAEEREDLRELLTVVAATHHLQEIDIPRPAAEDRAAGKRAFLQAAASMKSAAEATEASMATTASRATSNRPVMTTPTLGDRLATWWADLMSGFAPMTLRLTPLLAMIAAIWLGAFSAVNVAQAAIPGQPAYFAKSWFYAQKITLSAEADRWQIYTDYTEELKDDNARAGEQAVKEKKIVVSQADLVIDSIGRAHIELGGDIYELSYQKSLDSDELLPTQIIGVPAENAQASVKYQIVPDPNGAPGATVLQAISITIEEEPLVIPTALPTTVDAANPAVFDPSCTKEYHAGWVSYQIPPGVTLSYIAKQIRANVDDLVRVNCIVNSDLIRAGDRIMVPRAPGIISTPVMPTATTPPLAATLTGISTTQPTPLLTVTIPAEGTPTIAITSTVVITPEVSVTPATTITATVIATTTAVTATPVPSATVPITATTLAPRLTPTITVVTPSATPLATSAISETVVVTPKATLTPAEESTPTPSTTASSTATVTDEIPTTKTVTATQTPTAAVTKAVTTPATPTPDSGSGGVDEEEVSGASNEEGDEGSTADGQGTPTPISTPTALPTSPPATSTATAVRTRITPRPTATATAINASPLGSGG